MRRREEPMFRKSDAEYYHAFQETRNPYKRIPESIQKISQKTLEEYSEETVEDDEDRRDQC